MHEGDRHHYHGGRPLFCYGSNPTKSFCWIVRNKNNKKMKYLTFERIKQQLRLDDEQAQLEHDLLCMYGESAEDTVLNTLNRTLEDIIEQHGCIPMPIQHATLMLVDNAYKERSPISPQSMSTVPYAFDMILKPYMRLTV